MRTRTLVLLGSSIFLLLLRAPNLGAQISAGLPDTSVAKQFEGWLTAFNSGDATKIGEFLSKEWPGLPGGLQRTMETRQRTGALEIEKVLNSTPTNLTVLLKARDSETYIQAAIEVDAAPPYYIRRMLLVPAEPPSDRAPKRLTKSELVKALRARLESDSAAGRFSGAVLVAQHGTPIFQAAYGLADRARKIPNTLNTCFRLGSMNKMFTATAVLELVQAGKIRLSDTLDKYVKDYPNRDVASKVTIEELLTHTAGTGDFFGPEYAAHRLELKSLDDYVRLFGQRGLAFAPGSRFQYSNYGYILLGVVIERASGEDYYDYVRRHIFTPAGMNSTASPPEGEATAACAIGYTKVAGGVLQPNTNTLPYRGTSAGGGYSTVLDLLRFAVALENDKLLRADYTQMLTTGKVDMGPGLKYGYGFGVRDADGVHSYGHNGGAPGMNGDLVIFPQSGYVVAVLANLDPPAAEDISNFITRRLPES